MSVKFLVDGLISNHKDAEGQDLFDLVEHDIRHLGLPIKDYEEAIECLRDMTV